MNMEEKIILVADDDLDDQEMLEEVFLGIEKDALIHTVSSAKEALEYLRNCVPTALPCLIILDYNMPDLNYINIYPFSFGARPIHRCINRNAKKRVRSITSINLMIT